MKYCVCAIRSEKIWITMPKSTGFEYAGKNSDDGIRNKEQHEGKKARGGHATSITWVTPL